VISSWQIRPRPQAIHLEFLFQVSTIFRGWCPRARCRIGRECVGLQVQPRRILGIHLDDELFDRHDVPRVVVEPVAEDDGRRHVLVGDQPVDEVGRIEGVFADPPFRTRGGPSGDRFSSRGPPHPRSQPQ